MKPRLIKHIQNESRQSISLNEHIGYNCHNDGTHEKKRADMIRKSLEDLNEWELEFIYRRFGFYSLPMNINELQQEFYSDYSLDELKAIESSILYKLRNNDNLKNLVL